MQLVESVVDTPEGLVFTAAPVGDADVWTTSFITESGAEFTTRTLDTDPIVLAAAGDVARIQMIEPLSLDWTRNPPSVPDEFTVTVRSVTVPVDLRIIRGMQVGAWLYVHEDASEDLQARAARCQVGTPGYFGGVVDVVKRTSDGRELTLECRDYTAIPMATTLDLEQLDGISLDQPLPDIVRALIDLVPGGDQWVIVPRGQMATLGVPAYDLADEVKVRVASREQDARPKGNLYGMVGAFGNLDNVTLDPASAELVMLPDGPGFVDRGRADALKGLFISPRDADRASYFLANPEKFVTGSGPRKIPARVVSKTVPPTWAQLLGGADTVWEAITRLSQLMGAVAEVAVLDGGAVGVVLVDALELQLGDVLRPFERDGSAARVFEFGSNIVNMTDGRQLLGGQRIDWAEVQAADPVTGKMRRGRYGRSERSGAGSDHGLTVTAHGFTDQSHLDRLAKAAWLNANSGELELAVTTDDPWSLGGGPDDADLLGCGGGAVVDIDFAGLALADGVPLAVALRALGVPEDAADTLAAASAAASPSLRFQAVEVKHSYSQTDDGSYSCDLTLQTFLDDGSEHGAIDVGDIL